MFKSEILFFSFNYPPHDGGISRLCAEFVAGLLRKGASVHALSQLRNGAPGSLIPPAGESRVTGQRPGRELAALRKLLRIKPGTLVFCGLWYPEGLLAVLAGLKPVILAHGLELNPPTSLWRRPLWRWLMRLVLARAELVVANSGATTDLVRKASPRAKVVAVPLGVDHDRFCPGDGLAARRRLGIPADKRAILTVSRVVYNKGHSVVLKALARLPQDVRERFVYLVAGRGPAMDGLRKEADALGVGGLVLWLGYVPETNLPDFYRASDLFVMCSRQVPGRGEVEGFGLVYLEAQACGTPVIGTRTGGIAEAISENRGGLLIDQDDCTALAGLFKRLADRPKDFQIMGKLGRQRVEQECSWDSYVARVVATMARPTRTTRTVLIDAPATKSITRAR